MLQAAGEWAASEQALAAAESVQATIAMAGTGIGLPVRATALLAQGRLAEAEPQLASASLLAVHPSLRDLHALALLRAGRADDARAALGPWREQPELIWDYLWLSGAVLRALVWSELGRPAGRRRPAARLEPFADRVADGAMAACFLGSVRHALAALALAAEMRTPPRARGPDRPRPAPPAGLGPLGAAVAGVARPGRRAAGVIG